MKALFLTVLTTIGVVSSAWATTHYIVSGQIVTFTSGISISCNTYGSGAQYELAIGQGLEVGDDQVICTY